MRRTVRMRSAEHLGRWSSPPGGAAPGSCPPAGRARPAGRRRRPDRAAAASRPARSPGPRGSSGCAPGSASTTPPIGLVLDLLDRIAELESGRRAHARRHGGADDGPEPADPEVAGGSARRADQGRCGSGTPRSTASICCWPCSTSRRGWCRGCWRRPGADPDCCVSRLEEELARRPRVSGPGADAGPGVRHPAAGPAAGRGGAGGQAAQGRVRLRRAPAVALLEEGPAQRRRAAAARAGADPGPVPRGADRRSAATSGSPRRMPEVAYEALEKYGRDLVADAGAGRLDPVIGRDAEIRRVMQILSRKTKNNPVLIGDPGRRQDRDRGGAGAADRQRRRARRAAGQDGLRAGHGLRWWPARSTGASSRNGSRRC